MATHVIPKALHRNRSQSHQDIATTGRNLPQWPFPRRDTSNSNRGIRSGLPRTPACYGFSILAKVKPGREDAIRDHGKAIEKAIQNDPFYLAPLKLHYLKWLLFDIGNEKYFMYQGIFDTDFDKYTDDAVALFNKGGISTTLKTSKAFQKTGRRDPQGSSSSCRITIVRASWNTGNIRMSLLMKLRKPSS